MRACAPQRLPELRLGSPRPRCARAGRTPRAARRPSRRPGSRRSSSTPAPHQEQRSFTVTPLPRAAKQELAIADRQHDRLPLAGGDRQRQLGVAAWRSRPWRRCARRAARASAKHDAAKVHDHADRRLELALLRVDRERRGRAGGRKSRGAARAARRRAPGPAALGRRSPGRRPSARSGSALPPPRRAGGRRARRRSARQTRARWRRRRHVRPHRGLSESAGEGRANAASATMTSSGRRASRPRAATPTPASRASNCGPWPSAPSAS